MGTEQWMEEGDRTTLRESHATFERHGSLRDGALTEVGETEGEVAMGAAERLVAPLTLRDGLFRPPRRLMKLADFGEGASEEAGSMQRQERPIPKLRNIRMHLQRRDVRREKIDGADVVAGAVAALTQQERHPCLELRSPRSRPMMRARSAQSMAESLWPTS